MHPSCCPVAVINWFTNITAATNLNVPLLLWWIIALHCSCHRSSCQLCTAQAKIVVPPCSNSRHVVLCDLRSAGLPSESGARHWMGWPQQSNSIYKWKCCSWCYYDNRRNHLLFPAPQSAFPGRQRYIHVQKQWYNASISAHSTGRARCLMSHDVKMMMSLSACHSQLLSMTALWTCNCVDLLPAAKLLMRYLHACAMGALF